MTLQERMDAARRQIANPDPKSGLAAVQRFEAACAAAFVAEGNAGRLVDSFSGREIARVGTSRRVHDFAAYFGAHPEITAACIEETRRIRANG